MARDSLVATPTCTGPILGRWLLTLGCGMLPYFGAWGRRSKRGSSIGRCTGRLERGREELIAGSRQGQDQKSLQQFMCIYAGT